MIWLIGNRGMLGSDVEKLLEQRALPFITSDIDVDITDPAALRAFAGGRQIEWIINCSAYTAVDAAEDERDKAFLINADGVMNIARLAEEKGAALIHVSTDYVFDGEKPGAYREDDATNPIGAYGESKLAGEQRIAAVMNRFFIIRTAWLYGRTGKNFLLTMIRLFGERDEVRVVADQWGSPTYTGDLAAAIVKLVDDRSTRYGIYHYTNEGKTTWHEFATEICAQARKQGLVDRDVRVVPITTAEYPTRARRPKNSYLSKEKIIRELGVRCRDWREALADCIGNLRK
ncbi:MAG TPA: dTDP-4-dehydrorhamnose reductase [Spirochaetota bacterium]|nr:dTDP-4-dehydrorhamnose reductase [Spirochaetota bacterium]HPV40017.1 dTDP-4-dehydrorhamnose reductase [Spirochaetota bacterium]